MMYGLLILGVCFVISPAVSEAFVVNTHGRTLISNGKSPSLGNLQDYAPVSSDQQTGNHNFQQPNMMTGQNVQIQAVTSRPVFGKFGQSVQCLPTATNIQVPSGPSQEMFDYYNQLHHKGMPFPYIGQTQRSNSDPSGPGQELFDYYNQLHATRQPFPQLGQTNSNPSGPDQELFDYYNQLRATKQPFQTQQLEYGTGQDQHSPLNPIHQVTGTSGPLKIFQQPDHVPLSMTLTSQQGQLLSVHNNHNHHNHRPHQQQPTRSPSYGTLFGNQNEQGPPSGGDNNQQQPLPYVPPTTPRSRSGPIGYQPINIGKRSVREKRAINFNFDPNKINGLDANGLSTGNHPGVDQEGNSRLGAPSFFTDPFKYEMDQSNNPLPQRSESRGDGVLAFSNPSVFFGNSKSDSSQGSDTHGVDVGVQTQGSFPVSQPNGKDIDSKHKEEVTSISIGHMVTSVPSSALNQGASNGKQEAVNQGGPEATWSEQDVTASTIDQDSLVQEVSKFDPNKVNQALFNFFDPSSMMSATGRGKHHVLWRRAAGFDPSKMNAGSFQPSNMNAGSFDPNAVNTAKNQNPAAHPPGRFDPSSMPSGSYNPGQGNAGQSNPGGSMQQPTVTQTPPGGGQVGSNSNTQTGQSGQGSPSSSSSSFIPGNNGLFDPTAWSAYIGGK